MKNRRINVVDEQNWEETGWNCKRVQQDNFGFNNTGGHHESWRGEADKRPIRPSFKDPLCQGRRVRGPGHCDLGGKLTRQTDLELGAHRSMRSLASTVFDFFVEACSSHRPTFSLSFPMFDNNPQQLQRRRDLHLLFDIHSRLAEQSGNTPARPCGRQQLHKIADAHVPPAQFALVHRPSHSSLFNHGSPSHFFELSSPLFFLHTYLD